MSWYLPPRQFSSPWRTPSIPYLPLRQLGDYRPGRGGSEPAEGRLHHLAPVNRSQPDSERNPPRCDHPPRSGAIQNRNNGFFTRVSFKRSHPQADRPEQDPDAFVVVSDDDRVMGHRIGNQPHW